MMSLVYVHQMNGMMAAGFLNYFWNYCKGKIIWWVGDWYVSAIGFNFFLITLGLEHLYAVVLSIAHQNISIAHNCYSLQTLEFPVSRPPTPERSEECSVRMEYLYPVVPRVAHEYVPLIVYCYSPGNRKFFLYIFYSFKNSKNLQNQRSKFFFKIKIFEIYSFSLIFT